MINPVFFVGAILISASLAVAHGENKPGPHGGMIRMPGAFHTEVVVKNQTVTVYLLDIAFKNPSIKDSKVSVDYQPAGNASALRRAVDCQSFKEGSHFVCDFSVLKGVSLQKPGTLRVFATREKQTGAPAEYPLPLEF